MAGNAGHDVWIPVVRPSHQGTLYALRRRWRWIVIVALVGLTVAANLAGSAEPRYAARARLRLLGERSTPLTIDPRSSNDEMANIRAQYYVLRSPRILTEAVDRLDLATRWGTDRDSAARRVEGMIEPRKLMDANITELRVVTPIPQLSADLANTIVDVYLSHANQPRLAHAQRTLERLRQERDAQTRLLRDAEAQTLALRQEIGIAAGDGQLSMASLGSLRQTVVQAEAGLIEARIREETYSRANDDVLLALQTTSRDDRVSENLANRLIATETRLGELQRRYGTDHPLVQACEVEHRQLLRSGEAQVVRLGELVHADREAAEIRAGQSRQRLADAAGVLVAASGAYGQLLAAQHREETVRNLTNLLSQRVQQLEVEMTLSGPAADVIELASVPTVPELGTPLQVGMMAMGVSLLFGCMIAVMLDRFDGRIRGAEEVEWQLNVPMLGVAGSSRTLLAPARGGAAVESFRMIRNSIDFADHTLRSLCITAAGPKEGTSATVANLAWTWAEQGARVLVIDTNLARPSQHQLLGAAGATGLAEHLAQQTPLDELVQQTTVANVSLLAAGQLGQRKGQAVPALTPQALSALLLWARSRADIILFDTAPLLHASDPAMIARQADGTILVARRQWTATRDLRRAVHLLSSGGEGLLGVVLTGTPASASWDPMPVDESEPETESASHSRSAVSRQRKRTRQAA